MYDVERQAGEHCDLPPSESDQSEDALTSEDDPECPDEDDQ